MTLPHVSQDEIMERTNEGRDITTLDSSQITTFLTCPEQWNLQYRQNLTQVPKKDIPRGTAISKGTYLHRLFESYYKSRAICCPQDVAIAEAMSIDIDKETCHCSHSIQKHEDFGFQVCLSQGCNCQAFKAAEFPLSKEDRFLVQIRFSDYCGYEGSLLPELKAKSPEHVEVGFSTKIFEDEKRIFILEGRIDLIGTIAKNFDNGWCDHKGQERAHTLYNGSIQFRNYAMVLQLSTGVINYVRFHKKLSPDTYERQVISFSRIELASWKDELISIFDTVQRRTKTLDKTEPKHYFPMPRNWSSCTGKYGQNCEFTPICENFFNPSLAEHAKNTMYEIKPVWRPW